MTLQIKELANTAEALDAAIAKLAGIAAGAQVNPAIITQALAEAGADTAGYLWSAQRVAQAIAALAGGGLWAPIDSHVIVGGETEVVFTDLANNNYALFVDGLAMSNSGNLNVDIGISFDNGITYDSTVVTQHRRTFSSSFSRFNAGQTAFYVAGIPGSSDAWSTVFEAYFTNAGNAARATEYSAIFNATNVIDQLQWVTASHPTVGAVNAIRLRTTSDSFGKGKVTIAGRD